MDQAKNLIVGDTVVDTFMTHLTVQSVKIVYNHKQELLHILVTTQDKNNQEDTYHHEDIYLSDLDGVSDEEKSWLSWAKDHKDFLEEFDYIPSVRLIYIQGFAHGFVYKKQISYEEIMQK